MRRLRVVHVGNMDVARANGVQATVTGLARELPNFGVDVEMWNPTRDVGELTARVVNGVNVVDLPLRSSARFGIAGLDSAVRHALGERAGNIDVVHFHSVYRPDNLAVAQVDLQIPIVITPNGGYASEVTNGRHRAAKAAWRALYENRLVASATVLHAVSTAEVTRLSLLWPRHRVRLVPNAVDTEAIADHPCSDPEGPFVYLGRLAVDHKGLDLLVDGYAAASRSQSSLPDLLIAGPDFRGGMRNLNRRIWQHGLGHKIRLVGPVYGDAKIRLLRSARCFVHPSRWEGFPFAVLEAMGQGVPVMVTQGTNMREVVEASNCGVVAFGDVEGIASGLRQMARLPALPLHEMGRNGRDAITRNYTWSESARKMALLYHEASA